MKIILITLLVIVVLAVVGIFAFSIYVGWKFLHPPRKPIDMQPENYGIQRYQPVRFSSREAGIFLSGWYFSAQENGYASNQSTMIFAHGYTQNRLEPHLPALSLAAQLLQAGYDVLMFDFRNAGDSGGTRTTIGYFEQLDLLGAVDYVASTVPWHQIGLVGFSMGAATSLLVAGQDQRVQAVVADSAFSCLHTYLQEKLTDWTRLPRFPFNQIILTVIPLLSGANPRKVRPIDSIQSIKNSSVLLIHGTGDTTVPHHHSQLLFAAAQNAAHIETELWIIPKTGHVRSYAANPAQYAERVVQFLDRHLHIAKTP